MKIEKKIARKFGSRIQALRRAKNWSQEQLAVEAEVSTNYIGEIERAECNASLYVIARLAEALKLPISNLFDDA